VEKNHVEDLTTLAGRVRSARSRSIQGQTLKRFTVLLFLFMCILGLGIWFRHLSLPAKEEKWLSSDAPQQITVATTDRYAKVHLISYIDDGNPRTETLYISVTGPKVTPSTEVLITSGSLRGAKPSGAPFCSSALFRDDKSLKDDGTANPYACIISVRELNNLRDPFFPGDFFGSFKLPQVTQDTKDTFFTHLPALAVDETEPYPLPLYISNTTATEDYNSEDFVSVPEPKKNIWPSISVNASDYKLPAKSGPHVLYWQPVVTTTEILDGVTDVMSDTHIDSDQPSDGNFQDGEITWNSTGSLEPTLVATKSDRITSEDRWNFYSGIFFGVAAATGIAVVQELPKKFVIRRRKRFS
jgi:hypothetical protein